MPNPVKVDFGVVPVGSFFKHKGRTWKKLVDAKIVDETRSELGGAVDSNGQMKLFDFSSSVDIGLETNLAQNS